MRNVLTLLALLFCTACAWAQQLSVRWEELTAEDFRSAIQQSQGTCLLPFGILEKHGPHLPLGTDLLNVRHAALAAAQQEFAVVYPEYYFGQIFEARHEPGTVAYSSHLQLELLQETTDEMARNGCKKVIIVNGHGGNEHLLPRGTLREPPSHLARAHTIFITKSDGATAGLRERIARLNSTAAVIECVHQPLYFEDVFSGERKGLDFLAGKKVASLSGIAQPESFEKSIVKLGAELVYSKRFADHHRFKQQEILNTINRSKKRQAEIIITTQKDAVRFPKIDRRDLPIFFMRVEIKIVAGANDFQDCVSKICFR